MTLNQVVIRLKALALSHKQIHHFYFGDIIEWLANGDVQYPCCFVEINNSEISKEDHLTKYNLSIWFLDLVNVDTKTKANEIDVMSDLTAMAEDYTALLNYIDNQDDLTINTSYNLQYFREKFEDLTIAVKLDIMVAVDYTSNRCQVPSTGMVFPPVVPVDYNIVYNYIYTATGDEGSIIINAGLISKTILMLFKGDKLLVPSVSLSSTDQYNYNSATGEFDFGSDFEAGQVLQFIYK